MERPTRKQRKLLLIIGITGAVYLSFRYLLPLVIPFLIAYGMALLLKPSALWLEKHCRIRIKIKGREWRPSLGLIGGLELFLLILLAGIGFYAGGKRLIIEARLLCQNLPELLERLDVWLTGICFWMEGAFRLQKGCLVLILKDMLLDLGRAAKNSTMPFLVVNSMTIFRWIIQATVITVILTVATVLSLQEMETLKKRRERSAFHREFAILSSRLLVVGNAWLKTQLSIMTLTMIICSLGLMLLHNPYNILLGICIGLLDALPIFGTGTVLIPWAVCSFVVGNWGRGMVLLGIYVICYFLRELMEAKIMGDKVGLSALETLISMYVGLQLFGLLGFILGPIGLLIIEDLVAYYD